MLVGTHASIAGGFINGPQYAQKVGAEVIQIFSRSPRGGTAPLLNQKIALEFQQASKKCNIKECYIHTPYYINLASSDERISNNSIRIIREELDRASILGARYVMTHLGSANNLSRQKSLLQVIAGLIKILRTYHGSAQFLIENSAGAGNIIGDSLAEISYIIKSTEKKLAKKNVIGVCYDTCHGFASGYDIRTKSAYQKTIKQLAQQIGLARIKLFHFNDSKTEFNARRDRHEHIGQGQIGQEGFKLILQDKRFEKVNAILETPADDRGNDIINIRLLKKLRNN
ncbi:MAG: hypothetical protein COX77_01730 [Candidatus Komeilibacteria bacterium CG_4_10_14_0_2_um_filter_37_10]|uniref:Probable endonuclease 4 n=1 Tax=Candidatus Komeilibacteria bacterium CG_4_10_14_0_2_um_filter_37_10 TaxID=1974470 RepID=A0A2M7VFJ1_9BACT|nr:MAG: hypothetical protein COX77_01730 [Candidatus Komeilibacteria bacterium CG_4_10_14_0_2_um_filter_37_10]PJA92543.1 MAG: hypothetical protein CO133_02660 [Candidatus Komeilibacteria bacterium CG_4_9_14_3_um_filter_37_5]